MGSVTRHWRWLACSVLAVGCLLNPQPELPGSTPGVGDDSGGSSGSGSVAIGAGGASTSSGGRSPGASAGGPATASGGFGGTSLGTEEGGMGGALELPAAGATGESGAAGAPAVHALGAAAP